ncbi:uncharacterized protein LOC113378531 isoform X3 [Ctenocephalides felis]|uniref:uncharacterized protein LOC113378531 isoform X3 n=1 Tax=Ctenocephalides felis TaxID=7515 RepID=UPI000E6E230A|nr:uncharacterized protein LOC113378531 isoform X3 [Ctenocephalides felis]
MWQSAGRASACQRAAGGDILARSAGGVMSLDTLLEAARYIEQQEQKQKQQRLAAAKRRTSSFCRIDEEPYRASNGHHQQQQQQASAASGGGTSLAYSSGVPVERERHTSVGSDRSHRSSTSIATNHSTILDDGVNRTIAHNQTDGENGGVSSDHGSRRRTNSSSMGPLSMRSSKVPGTREVHNKLEKNRRAHLKECFELLKDQLPPSPDEKKASNLSILGSAIRYIQLLRRKERDYENEMERLAREKIASQQRITTLKRELSSTWEHIDFSKLLPDEVAAKTPDREHNQSSTPAPQSLGLRAEHRYSSSSSLSSAATAPSPSAVTTNNQMAITRASPITQLISPTAATIQKSNGQQVIQINQTNQHITTNGTSNGPTIVKTTNNQLGAKRELNMYTKQVPVNSKINNTYASGHLISQNALISNGKIARLEGQPQVKLVNGTPSLALVTQTDNHDKDVKVQPTQITLSQVIPGGSLVVSPIQLSLAPQNIRVLGSAATIELATSSSSQRLRDTSVTSTTHVRKILVPQSSAGSPVVAVPQENGANGPLGGRLPGGAELNLLPTNGGPQVVKNNSNHQPNILYRTNKTGGALIVNNGIALKSGENASSRPVHVMTPIGSCATSLSGLTPLVVSQSQGGQVTHIVASPSQLGGKYLSAALVKPMVVVSTSGNVQSTSTSSN